MFYASSFGESVSMEEDRLKVMDALDRCGWPIEERNIILLENEINQARLYQKQADDLMDMSTGKDTDSSLGSARDSEVSTYRS